MEDHPVAGWARRIIPYGTIIGSIPKVAFEVSIKEDRKNERVYTVWQMLLATVFITTLIFSVLFYANDLNQLRAVPGTNSNRRSIDCIHDIAYSASNETLTLKGFNSYQRTLAQNEEVCTWHNNTNAADRFAVVAEDGTQPWYRAPQLWLQLYMPSQPQYDFVILSSLILKGIVAAFVVIGAFVAFLEAFVVDGEFPTWMRQFYIDRSFWIDIGLYSALIGGCQMAYFYFAYDIKRVEFSAFDMPSQDRLYNAAALACATWATNFFCWMQLRNRAGFSLFVFLMTSWVYVDTFYYFYVWTWWYGAVTTYEEVFNAPVDKLFQFDYGSFASLTVVWSAFWTIMAIFSFSRFIFQVTNWKMEDIAKIKDTRANVLFYTVPVVWYYAFSVGHHDHHGKSTPLTIFNYFYQRVDFATGTTILNPALYCNSDQFVFNWAVGWETAILIAHSAVTALALIFYVWKVVVQYSKSDNDTIMGYFWDLVLIPEKEELGDDEFDPIIVWKDGHYEPVSLRDGMFLDGTVGEKAKSAFTSAQSPINLVSGEGDNSAKKFWDQV